MTEEFERSFDEHMLFMAALEGQSDLGRVLITASYIDDKLGRILEAFLVAKRAPKALFNGMGAPLGTFSARTSMAYALSLIDEREFSSINAIRKVRNIFAHDLTASFDLASVRSHLDTLAWSVDRNSLGQSGPLIVFSLASQRIAMQLLNRVDHVQGQRLAARDWPHERTDYDPDYDPY